MKPTIDQQRAIDYVESMVVVANPGSGKTFVLSQKIQLILTDCPKYKGVIAISFTNKASNELKKRSIKGKIDKKGSFFGTIDKFCDSEIIIPFLPHIWGKSSTDIVVKKIDDLPDDDKELLSEFDKNKIGMKEIKSLSAMIKKLYLSGTLVLEATGALALFVLKNSIACQKYIYARYSHIIIDEYQDSGNEQNEIFLSIKSLGLISIAVGDADQSIYGFSGKSSDYLLALAKSKDFKTFPITYNHRSHPSIVNYSQVLLDPDSVLLDTDEIRVFEKTCQGNEGVIGEWIDNVIDSYMQLFNVSKKSEVGILTRSINSATRISNHLSKSHRIFTAHELDGDFSLWSNLFSSLLYFRYDKSITSQDILDGFLDILTRTQLKQTRSLIRQARTIVKKQLPVLIENIAMILLPSSRNDHSLEILNRCVFDELKPYFSPAKDGEIQIMTMHKSKGMEFDIVFHADLCEWTFPTKFPGPNGDFENPIYPNSDQDFNLHYVAITRAKKALFLCNSTFRHNSSGQQRHGNPSEFLLLDYLKSIRNIV